MQFYRFLAEAPVLCLLNETKYQSHVRVRVRFVSDSGPVRVRVRFVPVSGSCSGWCPGSRLVRDRVRARVRDWVRVRVRVGSCLFSVWVCLVRVRVRVWIRVWFVSVSGPVRVVRV